MMEWHWVMLYLVLVWLGVLICLLGAAIFKTVLALSMAATASLAVLTSIS